MVSSATTLRPLSPDKEQTQFKASTLHNLPALKFSQVPRVRSSRVEEATVLSRFCSRSFYPPTGRLCTLRAEVGKTSDPLATRTPGGLPGSAQPHSPSQLFCGEPGMMGIRNPPGLKGRSKKHSPLLIQIVKCSGDNPLTEQTSPIFHPSWQF